MLHFVKISSLKEHLIRNGAKFENILKVCEQVLFRRFMCGKLFQWHVLRFEFGTIFAIFSSKISFLI